MDRRCELIFLLLSPSLSVPTDCFPLQIIADFAQAFEVTGKANGGWKDANGDAIEAKEVVPKSEHPAV